MKKIAITMGDPAGIGPEIIARALCNPEVRESCRPIVIGARDILDEASGLTEHRFKTNVITSPEMFDPSPGVANIMDIGAAGDIAKGRASAQGGTVAAACIRKSVELALNKQVDAIVTAPISKEAFRAAGLKWPGHTEMLAELTGTRDYAMMLAGGPLRVILVTIHAAIRNVPALITREAVMKTIALAKKACDMMGMKSPKIAVAGLNPHAGEAGLFGTEEAAVISPAVEEAQEQGLPVTGPYPPDTIFHKAYKGEVDIVVCMYHDQGLIPLKMISFDTGVNVTIGLPFIRTSPDHGTAYDIAWKGMARPTSMIEAIKLALRLRV
jgi:4-hydroxythreonine-4-phosphate dehydrogenase